MRVSEVFLSLQGEGLRVGHPSLFVRLFGCNFRCPGFGMPKGQKSTEPDEIAERINEFKTYQDLPLAKTGCDSYPSWHPKFAKFSPDIEPALLGEWINRELDGLDRSKVDLVITGGEPLMKCHQVEMVECDNIGLFNNFNTVTFETNCTQPLIDSFKCHFYNAIFSCSPKLSCSGVDHTKAIRPEVFSDYLDTGRVYLKFVVGGEEDLAEVKEILGEFGNPDVPVFLMPEGGTEERYNENMKRVADICLREGFIFSPRLHVSLYGNTWAK